MPLITDYKRVKEIYKNAAELEIALPAFCSEDRETLEAILASALEIGKEIGLDDIQSSQHGLHVIHHERR